MYALLKEEGAKPEYIDFFEARKSEMKGVTITATECVELYNSLNNG